MSINRVLTAALVVAVGISAALLLLGVTARVSAQTPTAVPCGTEPTSPCELTGHKLVANPNDPTLYVLKVETNEGPRSFIATRPVIERFARELLDAVEGRGVKPL